MPQGLCAQEPPADLSVWRSKLFKDHFDSFLIDKESVCYPKKDPKVLKDKRERSMVSMKDGKKPQSSTYIVSLKSHVKHEIRSIELFRQTNADSEHNDF